MIVFRAKRLWEVTAVIGSSPSSKSWYVVFRILVSICTSLGVINNMVLFGILFLVFFFFHFDSITVTRTPGAGPFVALSVVLLTVCRLRVYYYTQNCSHGLGHSYVAREKGNT